MMNHEELSTDQSSFSSSSPSSSPIHQQHIDHLPYTVQSPSSTSNDGDKSSVTSNHIGAAYTVQSPSSDSPSRVSSSFSSSGSRVSSSRRNLNWNWNGHEKGWNQCYVIVEEEEVEEDRQSDSWQWLVWVLLAFGFVGLLIWGVGTPYRPRVSVKRLAVNNFYFGEGLDHTGVPTKFLTINSTLDMAIRNRASFYGVYISSTTVDLSYLDIKVATGQMRSYYQPRKSEKSFLLNVKGLRVPLYGAGSSLAQAFNKGGVTLRLDFDIRSHVNIVFNVVKRKHLKHISCSANISRSNKGVVRFKKESCKYS